MNQAKTYPFRIKNSDWKRLLTLSSNMLAVIRFDGRFAYLNAAWEETLGFSKAEILSHSFLELVHPDDYDLLRNAFFRLALEAVTIPLEIRYRHDDGSYRWLQWQLASFLDEHYVYAHARDVTDQKGSIEVLQSLVSATAPVTGGNFFRSLTCNMAATLGVRFAFVSECTDQSRTRVRTLALWLGKEFGEDFEYALAGTPCEGVIDGNVCYYPQEVQALFPEDKDLVTLDAQSYVGIPLYDSAGAILGHLAVLDDKPMEDMDQVKRNSILQIFAARAAAELERKHAEEALARRATELETVAQVSLATATILDSQALLQAVVDLTRRHFNLYHTHIYLLDESESELILAAGAGEIGRQMVGRGWSIPLAQERSLVASAARKQQGIIANDVRSAPEYLPNALLPNTRAEMAIPLTVAGQLLGVLDVQADTRDYFTDDDLRVHSILAAQAAVALQNARLYAEQAALVARLRELEQLKSAFLASMSHELRTPLNSILGFTDLLLMELDGPLPPKVRSDLEVIHTSSEHLLSLINDVLDMAKIEAGKLHLAPVLFDLHEVLTEVVGIATPLAQEKSLALQLGPEANQVLAVEADRTRIRQVLLNLVGNAIKFTSVGGVTIDATHQNGALCLSVQDTGPGISPEQSEVIFEAFRRLNNAHTRNAPGTGLGLPISRRLVEMHGGRLWVESAGIPGQGATFFVELPTTYRPVEEPKEGSRHVC
ncbi:MAG: ATP-binding protein [Chloroflexi bacterium]|nr:ATP-binding protein [Chloroflexota bacterium]